MLAFILQIRKTNTFLKRLIKLSKITQLKYRPKVTCQLVGLFLLAYSSQQKTTFRPREQGWPL